LGTLLARGALFLDVVVELDLDVFFHLLVVGEVQLEVVFAFREIAGLVTIIPAELGTVGIDGTAILVVQVAAFVLDIDVPVPLLHEDGYIFVTEVPPDIVVVVPVLGSLEGEGKIPAA
jgi:hypothetical protein